MTNDNDDGGANPSYQGYDYQKLVTVWVALKLMFGPGASTDRITVEPASHDDIKADLDVPFDVAEANLIVAAAGELHVQIKFKGAGAWSLEPGAWSPKDFAAVVNDKSIKGVKGRKPRARAKAMMLANAQRRYVFITNASVDGTLASGRIEPPRLYRRAKLSENCPLWKMHKRRRPRSRIHLSSASVRFGWLWSTAMIISLRRRR